MPRDNRDESPEPIGRDLDRLLSGMDIQLLDQVLRGRFTRGMRVLDVGCGGGRNVVYFLREGLDVHAIDSSDVAVERVRALAAELAPAIPAENFRAEAIEESTFSDAFFEAVIANAVLHFAVDTSHFRAMLDSMWRVLAPGGLFFARLTSSIGIEEVIRPLGGGRFVLPDGSTRFLVNEATLVALTKELGGELLDPIKTVNVQGMRCMTTWVVRRRA